MDGTISVMLTQVGMHDFPLPRTATSWMPTSVGMTGMARSVRHSLRRLL
jgi:hypothetical protein